jgi:dipeptidase E
MKLFLSSVGIPNGQAYQALFEGVADRSVAVIFNAWDVYPAEKSRPFLYATQDLFAAMDFRHELVDLKQYAKKPSELSAALQRYSALWIMGGNSFYLNWLLREAGFDQIIRPLMAQGLVYGGESAGAVVAGRTLHGAEHIDNPALAPAEVWDGMGLVDFNIVPHWGNPKYAEALERCRAEMSTYGNVEAISDEQFITVRDNVATVWGAHD